MSVRSIIDIVVNDGAFKAFAKLYTAYSSSLPRTVAAWQAANVQVRQSQTLVSRLDASLASAATSVGKMTKTLSQDQVIWRTLVKHSDTFRSNIASATTSMIRLAGLAGATGGLLGIGSLFGLEHLAAGVGRGRSEASGVGTTYGQQRAFELTYGRFFNPGTLNRIGAAISDPRERWALGRLGAASGTLAGGDSVEVARQILPALKRFVDKTPVGNLGLLSENLGVSKFFSIEELKRLKSAKPGELAGLGGDFARRQGEFSRGTETERKFQDFDNMLDEAGEKIRTAFVEGIAPIIPSLTKLSSSLSTLVRDLLRDVRPADVQAFGDGIKSFATTIGSPEFRKKIDEFVTGVGLMADTVAGFLSKLGVGGAAPSPPGKHRMTFRESLAVEGGGGAGAYFRGDLVDNRIVEPKPRYVGHVRGGPRPEKPAPTIGAMGTNFDEYANGMFPKVSNQTSNDVTLTVRSPNGGSVPRAAAQVGSVP